MNRLEFVETLKGLDIKQASAASGRYGNTETLQFLKNIRLYMGPTYYAVVRGKIPLEVANIIWEKYPNNPYLIRVMGGNESAAPLQYAVDDKYVTEIEENIELYEGCEYGQKCKEAKSKLLKRKDENKYITSYHIDTKEGLVIFLTEMKDYYARKLGLQETEVARFDELMASITEKILGKVNPTISCDEWMQADEENREIYFDTIARNNQTPIGKLIRSTLDGFDRMVNPYINDDIQLDEIKSYLSKVNISAYLYNYRRGKARDNCCEMHIRDKETQSIVSYFRDHDGFAYQLLYSLGEQEYLNVCHYFSGTEVNKNETGESIYIDYYGDNVKEPFSIRYNITHGLVNGKNNTPITEAQLETVYKWLLKATECASNVTLKNMQKSVCKKIQPSNN